MPGLTFKFPMRCRSILGWISIGLVFTIPSLSAASPAAQPIVISSAPDNVAVTIYRAPNRSPGDAMDTDWLEGYALITEKRTIDLPAGPATIRFEGVAGGMLPESVIVRGLPVGVREKNLDADLLSPGSLYARSLGRPVTIRRQHRKSGKTTEERAIIRSGPEGSVLLQTREGFEAANCGPLIETLVYPGLPENLSARPTLSIKTDASSPAKITLSLSYLAWGFDWQTNYVVRMREGGKSADISAWVTLASSDPISFVDADTAVVGGEVNREDEDNDSGRQTERLVFHCFFRPVPIVQHALMLASPNMDEGLGEIIVTAQRRKENNTYAPVTVTAEGLGDLKLYRVPVPTTVASNAQKQVAMFEKRNVKIAIVYTADVFNGDPSDVVLKLRAQNKQEDGLGIALPAGPVAVFEPLRNDQMLIGEGGIGDRAVGQEVEAKINAATHVQVQGREVTDSKEKRRWRDFELVVSNANRWPVTFEGDLHVDEHEKIARTSARMNRKNGRPLWQVQVPSNGVATLRYRVVPIEAE
jgi:hypothetical protein